ncbi:DUF3054 domain-containing protein [Rothia sp. LK2492]|uniref:DUF3054 domain-containing protein n=1 Tax=Rothia sp. LK2492 TaxID=3114370 RepID=UPI0034CEFA7A
MPLSSSTKQLPNQFLRLCIDVALVLIFIAIGLMSHGEDLSDILRASAPFLTSALSAHILIWVINTRRDLPLMAEAIIAWSITLVVGMALRISFGDTAATAFVIVSTLTLFVFLVGWRLIIIFVGRSRR